MPHLSPMSWLSILLLLWITMMALSASMYFMKAPKFLNPKSKSMIILQSKWNWLQGGRAMNNKL